MRRNPAPWWALLLADTALLAVVLGGYMLTQQILPALSAPPPTAVVSPPPAQEEAGPEEEQADSPEDPAVLTWAQRFAQHFSPTVETGDGYYRSPGLSITVTAHTQGSAEEGDLLTWYVADIYLADIGSFQTVLAGGEDHGRGSTADPMELYAASGGILAISGDFESYGSGGTVIRNGLLYRDETAYTDVCVLFRDGRLVCYPPGALDLDGLEAGEEPLHAWTFGPTLVENGALSERLYQRESWRAKEPRAALGYFEPGHYCFVVADGRQYGYSNGASLETLAQIFVELGCETAYNLDGGGSAFMAFNGERVNRQSSNRRLGDLLVIGETEEAGT